MSSYTGRFTTSRRTPLTEQQTDTLMELLDVYHPSLSELTGPLDVTISYPAENFRQAALTGDAVIAAALNAAGLPGEVVAADLMPTDVFDRRHGMEPVPELLSVTEAAAELGVTPQAVRQRLDSGSIHGVKAGATWVVPRGEVLRVKKAAIPTDERGPAFRREPTEVITYP